VHVVNDLRQRLIDVFAGVAQSVIDDGTDHGSDVSMPAFEPRDIFNIHSDIN